MTIKRTIKKKEKKTTNQMKRLKVTNVNSDYDPKDEKEEQEDTTDRKRRRRHIVLDDSEEEEEEYENDDDEENEEDINYNLDREEATDVNVAIINKFWRSGRRFVWLSGAAGTGKSHVIKELCDHWKFYKDDGIVEDEDDAASSIAIVAPTGVAALNLKETGIMSAKTIHSRFGLPFDNTKSLSRRAQCALEDVTLVVIDEISMVNESLLTRILSNLSYGCRVLVVGDFRQLPPVSGQPAFFSRYWQRFRQLRLRYNYRQSSDPTYGRILHAIRVGGINDVQLKLLNDTCTRPATRSVPRLFARNNDVDRFNDRRLTIDDDFKDKPFIESRASIHITAWKQSGGITASDRRLATALAMDHKKLQSLLPVPLLLRVKKGCVVMTRRNYEVEGMANGSTSTLEHANNNNSTWFLKGHKAVIRVPFLVPVGKTGCVQVFQYPLVVAFAVSIHKSQGSTMTRVCVSPSVFRCGGMLYTALSRVTTMKGLYLTRRIKASDVDESTNHVKLVEQDHDALALVIRLHRMRKTSAIADVGNLASEILQFL
jgi:ATP-dependent DNA helicase PIF1